MSKKLPRNEAPFYIEDRLHLPEGAVVVRTPPCLSQESVESVGDFLELVLAQIARIRNDGNE